MVDLGGREGSLESQRGHETLGERRPVDVREGDLVGVHVTGRATELGRPGKERELPQLLLKTGDEHLELLAEPCRSGRLTMRPGEHRDILPSLNIGCQNGDHLFQSGNIFILKSLLEHQRLGRVVDVLRGQPEVDELLPAGYSKSLEILLDEVFNGFDIVVGDLLDVLHLPGVFRSHRLIKHTQTGEEFIAGQPRAFAEVRELGQRNFAQGDEIFHLHAYTVANQGELAEILSQRCGFGSIATIDRGHCQKRMKVHIHVRLFFYDVHIIAGFRKPEVLAGELFQSVFTVGQTVDLTVHVLDLGAVPLNQPFLTADLKTSLDPTDNVVLVDKAHHDGEKNSHADGIADKGAPFSVLAIQIPIPDVLELSHCFRTIFVQK